MSQATCPRFETCEASICPLDEERGKRWYPGEPVCKRQSSGDFTVPQWLITQRKIARKTNGFELGYFTRVMMDRNIVVRRGIKGLNPDRPPSSEAMLVRAWLRKHPAIVVKRAKRESGKTAVKSLLTHVAVFE